MFEENTTKFEKTSSNFEDFSTKLRGEIFNLREVIEEGQNKEGQGTRKE